MNGVHFINMYTDFFDYLIPVGLYYIETKNTTGVDLKRIYSDYTNY